MKRILTLLFSLLLLSASVVAQETVLRSFFGQYGDNPVGTLVFDPVGNLYGATYYGGSGTCNGIGFSGCGIVFELSPGSGGVWTEKVLHFFSDTDDGNSPVGALILDAAGNIYGTTNYGGKGTCTNAEGYTGCGTVFELTPTADGRWKEKVLHSFVEDGVDGLEPTAGLIMDTAGNLYGTTIGGGGGGAYIRGTVFELSPGANGSWSETILHNFDACCNVDGYDPNSTLIFDSAGNLYGTTEAGGPNLQGTVYELSPAGDGTWTETILRSFEDDSVGYDPSGVVMDARGNLYGTTPLANRGRGGAIFELSPVAGGGWVETTLHSFGDSNQNPHVPNGPLIIDASGNLYGVTRVGGARQAGTAFKLEPQAGGTWNYVTLYSFGSYAGDGDLPAAGLTFDASGNLYGTTPDGGKRGYGTVFEIMH